MTIIHPLVVGNSVLLTRVELDKLVELANQSEEVVLDLQQNVATTNDFMQMADQGRAFDFWKEDGEDVYTVEDGEPL